MFDDYHPGIVAGLVGAFISILLNKFYYVISVFCKRQQVVESIKVLDDRLRPVLLRMAKYDPDTPWTKELNGAKDMTKLVSWYNVFNLLKLNEIINSPTSDIYTTMKVAQLVAAEAAAHAAESRVVVKEHVLVQQNGQWVPHTFFFSPLRPPTPTPLPEESAVVNECVLMHQNGQWVPHNFFVSPPRPPTPTPLRSGESKQWEWKWAAESRSGKWEWQWIRVPIETDLQSPIHIAQRILEKKVPPPRPEQRRRPIGMPLIRISSWPRPEKEDKKPPEKKEDKKPYPPSREKENKEEDEKPHLKYFAEQEDFDEEEEPPQMYFGGHQARQKEDYPKRKKEKKKENKKKKMEKGDIKEQEGKKIKEEAKRKEKEPYKQKSSQKNKKEKCPEEEMPHHQHHREKEEARREENEEKMAPYEKECKNLLSSSEDPLHTISSSHQEEIHPQGLPRRRRGGGIREYGHGNEADASAHPHFP